MANYYTYHLETWLHKEKEILTQEEPSEVNEA